MKVEGSAPTSPEPRGPVATCARAAARRGAVLGMLIAFAIALSLTGGCLSLGFIGLAIGMIMMAGLGSAAGAVIGAFVGLAVRRTDTVWRHRLAGFLMGALLASLPILAALDSTPPTRQLLGLALYALWGGASGLAAADAKT